jgi:hypothetical protein
LEDGGGSFSQHTTDDTPKGQYTRGPGTSRPVNIENIKTSTDTLSPEGGVSAVGNYTKTYELYQTQDRSKTNLDFATNTEDYFKNPAFTSGSMPTPFVTTPARRTSGDTGSVDYASPRQRSGVKINKAVIAERFAAPGSKFDSTTMFRDRPSDQIFSKQCSAL